MRRAFLFVLLFLAVVQPLGWGAPRLVWSDEFDKPGAPDPDKWDYEVGFVRNKELQYYTRDRRENARVEEGCLVIEARKERVPNPRYKAGAKRWQRSREFAEYTAASLITRGKMAWRYGRIEVRAKVPEGSGMWPAIWMLGDNIGKNGWPRCGEIDIMEFVGQHPNRVYATVHYAGADGKHASKGKKFDTPAPYKDFHVYAVEWRADRMDFFYDDRRYHTVPLDVAGEGEGNPFRKPLYLLINLALGGWGGPMDDSKLPARYLIDYVRVYAFEDK